jgi:hypothetical protein
MALHEFSHVSLFLDYSGGNRKVPMAETRFKWSAPRLLGSHSIFSLFLCPLFAGFCKKVRNINRSKMLEIGRYS